MRKRIVAAILALAMSVSMMACGAKSDSKQENTATTKEVDSMSFSGTVPEKEHYVLDDRSFLYDSGRFDIRFMPECLIRGVEVFSYKVK